MNLITDRTQGDVDYRDMLAERIRSRTATPDEWAEWLNGIKGAYNATDYNRVGEALIYLGGMLNDAGYGVSVSPKTDWTYTDIPTPAQQESYLRDVRSIRDAMAVAIPVPGDMESPTFEAANDIERILVEAETALIRMMQVFPRAGAEIAGLHYYIIN